MDLKNLLKLVLVEIFIFNLFYFEMSDELGVKISVVLVKLDKVFVYL